MPSRGCERADKTFELVGIAQQPSVDSLADSSGVHIPTGALPESIQPATVQILANVDEANVPELRRSLDSVPGTFVLETAIFSRLITSLTGYLHGLSDDGSPCSA